MYAVIGGSGLGQLPDFEVTRRQVLRTPYGEPSGALLIGTLAGREVVFLARHGYGHTLAPHEINYRANLWALAQLEIDGILAVASVGGIQPQFGPGTLMVPDQIIDYTHGRAATFFEGDNQAVQHIDFTWPYDSGLRTALVAAADAVGEPVVQGGCYACTQGPRLETAAEIRRLARDGADIVGMTGMPEVALARELDIPYAHLALVVNHAAGVGDSAREISHAQISKTVQDGMVRVMAVLKSLVQLHED
ncbi:S-methyl-5'-thioinosine phosphorylase [Limnobacter humi]|uniref:Probable 6-oxopurine nucleoside phosphorylase n=1 Tax=Limnobacter humi TaxID=1778671 RepID=A0ABT1WF59_9BURK|nr:S-methyl-5'-thioinosine phosphorylase [Limnobacter humi]MCQ8896039.1 S-methyl-5'-thioinosine phosphorylase [Limnobacter humi]